MQVQLYDGASAETQGRGLPEVEARRLLQQLLVALQYSHARGVANRDVKVLACVLASVLPV